MLSYSQSMVMLYGRMSLKVYDLEMIIGGSLECLCIL